MIRKRHPKERGENMAVARPLEKAKQRITEEEFLRMPLEGKYELVDGEVQSVPAAFSHDVIGMNLALRLGPLTGEIGWLAGSQAGFRMSNGNIRCPDLSLMLYTRFEDSELPPGFGPFAPDLCVEIISPSESRQEMEDKVNEYFEAGAQQVWQMFPEGVQVIVFTSPDAFTAYHADDELTGGDLIPGFVCRVSELFDVRRKPPSTR
jgi:Uma2 family endonuclease